MWIVYDYTRQYMTLPTVTVGIVLLLGVIGIIVLLIAEAHEWAESMWLVKWRRPFPLRAVADEELPFVSVHVPAYNEPPALLIATLDALAALDYPAIRGLGRGQQHQGSGYLASGAGPLREARGALPLFPRRPAFRLQGRRPQLRPARDRAGGGVVAVIDADYLVRPTWLRDLVPAFAESGGRHCPGPTGLSRRRQNAFKAMCLAEYCGFFHIGMVTRNERNAIIQHGTMTMVARDPGGRGRLGGVVHHRGCRARPALVRGGHKALYIPTTTVAA